MGDFFQHGAIATLHDLGGRATEDLEAELAAFTVDRPVTLVLPCLYSELEGTALPRIVNELVRVPYLSEIVIGLDHADQSQFEDAKVFFDRLPQRHVVLWHDGPRLRALDDELLSNDLAPTQPGKGRNVWYCLGYFLGATRTKAVALHDCDIVSYDRRLLARLCYPIVHPTFEYSFCKGYYYRASDGHLNGRVTRLLVSPLVRALQTTVGPIGFLDFLDDFRYPLAGEFSMRSEVVSSLRLPADWGLEIGVLAEVYRLHATERVCQVDLADAYDHKHQRLSADDPTAGLHRMSIDIARALYRKLAALGVVFSPEVFRTVRATYFRIALDLVDRYHNDAAMSGLRIDRHKEEATVELFAQAIMSAGDQFLSYPMDLPHIPSWSRVESALDGFLPRLCSVVDADNT